MERLAVERQKMELRDSIEENLRKISAADRRKFMTEHGEQIRLASTSIYDLLDITDTLAEKVAILELEEDDRRVGTEAKKRREQKEFDKQLKKRQLERDEELARRLQSEAETGMPYQHGGVEAPPMKWLPPPTD